ncbi:hypothetical protein CF326_g5042 [Tilletia indica]|nr:hypothetical protein CF326_g5042 [Tilletia indica]
MSSSPTPSTLPPYDRSNSSHRSWARHSFELWKLTDHLLHSLAWCEADDPCHLAFLHAADLHRQALLYHDTLRPYNPFTTGCGYDTEELASYRHPLTATHLAASFSDAALAATVKGCADRQLRLEALEERVLDAQVLTRRLASRGADAFQIQQAQETFTNHCRGLIDFLFTPDAVTRGTSFSTIGSPDSTSFTTLPISPQHIPSEHETGCAKSSLGDDTAASTHEGTNRSTNAMGPTPMTSPGAAVLSSVSTSEMVSDSSPAFVNTGTNSPIAAWSAAGHKNASSYTSNSRCGEDKDTEHAMYKAVSFPSDESTWWRCPTKADGLEDSVQGPVTKDGNRNMADISEMAFSSCAPNSLTSTDIRTSSVDKLGSTDPSTTSVLTSVSESEYPPSCSTFDGADFARQQPQAAHADDDGDALPFLAGSQSTADRSTSISATADHVNEKISDRSFLRSIDQGSSSATSSIASTDASALFSTCGDTTVGPFSPYHPDKTPSDASGADMVENDFSALDVKHMDQGQPPLSWAEEAEAADSYTTASSPRLDASAGPACAFPGHHEPTSIDIALNRVDAAWRLARRSLLVERTQARMRSMSLTLTGGKVSTLRTSADVALDRVRAALSVIRAPPIPAVLPFSTSTSLASMSPSCIPEISFSPSSFVPSVALLLSALPSRPAALVPCFFNHTHILCF